MLKCYKKSDLIPFTVLKHPIIKKLSRCNDIVPNSVKWFQFRFEKAHLNRHNKTNSNNHKIEIWWQCQDSGGNEFDFNNWNKMSRRFS